ncbi:MAG: tetratricopeptide repeat protein [Bacteroidetes bacterium]|nr:tetratricopeptide repeat protein [Bacteroidota bacterium]
MNQKKKDKKVIAKKEESIKGVEKRKLLRWLSLLLPIVAFALYANTLGNDYTVDDGTVMQNNKLVKQGVSAIPEILTTPYRKGFWDRNESLYRPLSVVMFAVEWQLAPENPMPGHIINVMLYILTAFVLFRFLLLVFNQNMLLAFSTTLLYIVHPIHTEVVANIKSRDEILCFLFIILSFYYFLKGLNEKKWLHYLLAAIFFFLSLMSKESSITCVAVYPLLAYFFRSKNMMESLRASLIPWCAALVYLGVRFMVLKGVSNFTEILPINNSLVNATSITDRLATAMMILGKYLWLLIVPYPLSFDYSFNTFPIVSFGDIRAIIALIIYIALGIFAIRGFTKRNPAAFGIAFFLITISIISNVFFLIESVMAERFTYLPSLGICMAGIVVSAHLLKLQYKNSDYVNVSSVLSANKIFFTLVFSVSLIYSVMTIARNRDWKNNLTLLETDVKTCPESARIRYAYGSAILIEQALKEKNHDKKMNLLDKSIVQLEKGVSILPTYSEAYYHLGIAYKERENYQNAVACFERAAKNKTFTDPQFFVSWGVSCGKAGMYEQSIKALNHAIELDPNTLDAYLNLGVFYDEMKRYDDAISSLKSALKIDSKSENACYNMGNTYAHKINFPEAIKWYKKALEINPTYEDAVNNIGNSYAAMQDYANAIIYFRKAIEINPSNTKALNNLGITLIMTGNRAEGEKYISQAKQLGG